VRSASPLQANQFGANSNMVQQDDGDHKRPLSVQVSKGAPQPLIAGYKVAIRRTGPSVEITLTAGNEYASIELYDSLIQSINKGSLRLELKLGPSQTS